MLTEAEHRAIREMVGEALKRGGVPLWKSRRVLNDIDLYFFANLPFPAPPQEPRRDQALP